MMRLDSQDILDRLERGELDIEGALASFDDAPAPERSASGKIILSNVDGAAEVEVEPTARATSRIRLDDERRLTTPVVELEMHDGGIAFVQMHDDHNANMFTTDLLAGLVEVFAEIEKLAAESKAKVVVVTGTETWFCCGGTHTALAEMQDGRASFFGMVDGFRLLLDCSLPTIAAMRGHALGGGLTFGLYADVALLADNAYYAANFMEHGMTPGVGTTYILPKKIGAVLGAEMMFTAQRYQGRDLRARGVSLEVLEKDNVLTRAFAIAREIAKSPIQQIKLLKRRTIEETQRDLPRVLAEEDRMHAQCFPRALSFSSSSSSSSSSRADTQRSSSPRDYATLLVERRDAFWSIAMNRPDAKNSINEQLLDDLHAAFDEVDASARANVIVLSGHPAAGVFCTGLDFHTTTTTTTTTTFTSRYMDLLKRLSSIPKIVIALVDGDVIAGGMGLVAASDFVLATKRSTFALSEALWGLIPAMVLPFLIRRIGVGSAYAMTLDASTINAEAARAIGLVDEVVTEVTGDDPIRVIERKARRFERLEASTIGEIKKYFRELWIVDETTEERAVAAINRLLSDPNIQKRMKDYAETGRLPWEHEG